MSNYLCHYRFGEEFKNVIDDPELSVRGVDAFANGFWLDKDMKLSNKFSGQYWIPPWQVVFVSKVSVPPCPEDPPGVA